MKFLSMLAIALLSLSAMAQELVGVRIDPAEITVHQSVQLTLEFKEINEHGVCNVLLGFGDGKSENVRVETGKTPVKLNHTFDTEGNFAISAEGKTHFRGLATVFGCAGSNRSVALAVRPDDYATKAAAEEAEKKAAYQRAAAERRAAQAEVAKAAAEHAAAGSEARRAKSEREAAQKAANAAAAERLAQEKAASDKARAAAVAGMRKDTAGAAAAGEAPPVRPAETPKKASPIKAGSAVDL
jgi:hypothetical protein